MNDFVFHTPTKVFFGRGGEKKVGEILRSYGFSKVLFHYGSGSIKRSGLYDTVVASLKDAGISFVELGGVESRKTGTGGKGRPDPCRRRRKRP